MLDQQDLQCFEKGQPTPIHLIPPFPASELDCISERNVSDNEELDAGEALLLFACDEAVNKEAV
jgi:hypothetical protein